MSGAEVDNSDLFDGFGDGSLHFYVVADSELKPYETDDSTYLELDFHFSDWKALFVKTLKVPEYEEYKFDEDIKLFEERNRKKFQESIPDYPMLSRIFDIYEDYVFTTSEILCLSRNAEK